MPLQMWGVTYLGAAHDPVHVAVHSGHGGLRFILNRISAYVRWTFPHGASLDLRTRAGWQSVGRLLLFILVFWVASNTIIEVKQYVQRPPPPADTFEIKPFTGYVTSGAAASYKGAESPSKTRIRNLPVMTSGGVSE